jgi:hypothetical protein
VVLQRERSDSLPGSREDCVEHGRSDHEDRWLADATPNPPGGMMMHSTFGIALIRIES